MTDLAAPFVLAPGQSRGHPSADIMIKLGADDSDSALTVLYQSLAPWASGPPLHSHRSEDEAFYVLAGTLLLQVGQQRYQIPAGGFAWLPRGVPHTFANATGQPLRAIGLAVPGGIEDLLAEQAAYLASLTGPPDPGVLAALGALHGTTVLGPPITAAPRGPASSGVWPSFTAGHLG
jgi:quercetin dioxygenase-like cupin family protein